MDSNFKLNQLYLFSDLTIAKVVNQQKAYPTFKEMRSENQFAFDIDETSKYTELFFKIEDKYKVNLRENFCAFQFLTDLFQLVFHRHSILIQTKIGYNATLLSNKNHLDCLLKYEDKFILKASGKQTADVLISNFDREIAEQILSKHKRLFNCL